MSESKHTPGPWEHAHTATPDYARKSIVYAPSEGGRDLALVYASEHHDADAALIAAAPDMLAALTEMVAEWDTSDDYASASHRIEMYTVAIEQARAAIEKAGAAS